METFNVEENLGVIAKSKNFVRLGVEVVNFAVNYGMEIELDVWKEDEPIFLEGHATHEMLQDLTYVADIAGAYIESLLPEGYELLFTEDSLSIVKIDDLTKDNEV